MIENLDLIMETGTYMIAVLFGLVVISIGLVSMFLTAGMYLPIPVRDDMDNFYYKDRKIWGDSAGYIMLGFACWILAVVFVLPFVLGLIGVAIGITPP